MLKIEFDPTNTALAAAIGRALTEYAGGAVPSVDHVPYYARDPEALHVNAPKPASTVTVSAGETVRTDAASTVTEQDSPTDHAAEETVAGAAGQAGSAATNAPADAGSVDEKGVPFDGDYCAKAAKPFYATGKKSGQWKKKTGVEEDEYDEWYGSQLSKVVKAPANDQEFDTSAAFGGQASANDGPKDGGSFMKWVSEQQAAGNLTQEQLDAAYEFTGVGVADMWGKTGALVVAVIYTFIVYGTGSPEYLAADAALMPTS